MILHDDITISRAVRKAFSPFSRFVEYDDARQEAFVWWYSGPGQAVAAADKGPAYTITALSRFIRTWCEGEKARVLGYAVGDTHRYGPSEIRRLLPLALDRASTVLASPAPSDGRGGGDPSEGGNLAAYVVDVRRAVDALNSSDSLLVLLAEQHASDWHHIGKVLRVEPESVERQHRRVIAKMVRFLNEPNEPHRPRRRILTNAAAQSITSTSYEGRGE